jgi:multidrug transporter EmrE-like cation transporter
MEQVSVQTRQERARRLRKVVIALVGVVAAQVVALEVVLRGWQAGEALTVFAGIGASGLLCASAVIIFLLTRKRAQP